VFAAMGIKPKSMPADSDAPEFPWALDYLWSHFADLCQGIKSNGMGPQMADWADVQSWCSAVQLDLDPWEKRALVRLSNLRAAIHSEEKPKAPGKQ
jgi:hypothetical protein